MLEISLQKKKKTNVSPGLLSIDFVDATVGSKNMIDTSASGRTFVRKIMAGTPTGVDGVVDHPTFGKCYQFDGCTWFDCADVLQFGTKDYQMEIDFVPFDKNRNNTLFRSGDYNRYGPVEGILINLNQFPNTYFQAFCTGGGSYGRAFLPETNPGQILERVVVSRIGGNIVLENKRTGSKSTTALAKPSRDNYLAIGNSDDLTTAYSFIGLLKRLKISAL